MKNEIEKEKEVESAFLREAREFADRWESDEEKRAEGTNGVFEVSEIGGTVFVDFGMGWFYELKKLSLSENPEEIEMRDSNFIEFGEESEENPEFVIFENLETFFRSLREKGEAGSEKIRWDGRRIEKI